MKMLLQRAERFWNRAQQSPCSGEARSENRTPNVKIDNARERACLSAAPLAAIATSTAAAATAAIAATTAAVAPATAAVAAATTTITTAASAAAWRPSLTRACFVHGQRTAFHRLAIEFRDRLLRIRFRRHRDKGEAARFAGELILHQRDLLDWSRLSEKILKIGFGRVEGKISYV
jgi:hypothetical protein